MAFILVRDADNVVLQVNAVAVGAGAGQTEYNETFTFIPNADDVTWVRNGAADYSISDDSTGPLQDGDELTGFSYLEIDHTADDTDGAYAAVIKNGPGVVGVQNQHGVHIMSGEVDGDISLRISDQDNSFTMMEVDANGNGIAYGDTHANVVASQGFVYGHDVRYTAGAGLAQGRADFNTQNGVYRIAGAPVLHGTYFDYVDRSTTLTATTTTWVNYVTLTTQDLPAGRYRIAYSAVGRNSSAGGDWRTRINVDSGTFFVTAPNQGGYVGAESKDAGGDQRMTHAGFRWITLTAGVHTIAMELSQAGGGTATHYYGSIEIWRID